MKAGTAHQFLIKGVFGFLFPVKTKINVKGPSTTTENSKQKTVVGWTLPTNSFIAALDCIKVRG